MFIHDLLGNPVTAISPLADRGRSLESERLADSADRRTTCTPVPGVSRARVRYGRRAAASPPDCAPLCWAGPARPHVPRARLEVPDAPTTRLHHRAGAPARTRVHDCVHDGVHDCSRAGGGSDL